MPERKVTRKVETPDIQGADSWVMLRPMTVGEVISLQREAEESPGLWLRLVARLRHLFRIAEKPLPRHKTYENFTRRVLGFVADWNWVDDDGEPLPNPRDNPDVVKRLVDKEVLALVKIVYGKNEADDIKN